MLVPGQSPPWLRSEIRKAVVASSRERFANAPTLFQGLAVCSASPTDSPIPEIRGHSAWRLYADSLVELPQLNLRQDVVRT